MSDPLVCADCGLNYVMTASEKVRFAELVKNVQGFQMPKRCPECRKRRRLEKNSQQHQGVPPGYPSASPSTPSTAFVAVPQQKAPVETEVIEETVTRTQKEEVRFVLATTDFEDLVHGRPVVWQGVRVVLADIGFKVMREAIERAEFERAKSLYKKNGTE